MQLPTQSRPADRSFRSAAVWTSQEETGVTPQQRVCTPCVRVGGGRWCVNLPIVGRRCFSVPGFGRWRACCRIRLGWPPVTCGLSRC